MKVNRTALRTIEILEYISKSHSGASLLEIAQAMEIPKSSVFDIIKTLLYKKMIVEDQVSGKIRYRMGIHAFVVGSSSLDRIDLVDISKQRLIPLAQSFDATTFLAILDECMVTYLYKYESQNSQITTANLGTRKSVHCTALGKVLLAFQRDQKVIDDVLEVTQFEPLTEYTITSIKDYLIELEKVRQKGYGVDYREDTLYQVCVAAPIFNHNKKIIAAISCVSCYTDDFQVEKVGEAVKDVALEISKELGFSL